MDLRPPTETACDKPAAAAQAVSAVETFMQPLRGLLADDVTEIVINRPGEAWTESRAGWQRHALPQLTYEHLRTFATLIANSTQQTIHDGAPLVSAALPSGERVQAVIPPAVAAGTVSLTIRKPSPLRFDLDDYERAGAFDHVAIGEDPTRALEDQLSALLAAHRIREFLELSIQTRQNIVISGATGSGKTTVMKALVDLIPAHERLITIEDTPELDILKQPNHVRLFYSKDGQGVSKATPKMLLEACLRMKPDRILLAELRSDEAFYFLRNVNSGHPGSITSVHATSPRLAIEQLMLLVKESAGGAHLAREDIKQLLFMLVDVVVQFSIVDTVRRVTGIYYDPQRKRTLLG
jgi:type IV secretion system protein VirB11